MSKTQTNQNGGGKKQEIIIHGRSTACGARTYVYKINVVKGTATVKRTNYSKTGRHWTERVFVSSDFTGEIYVVDFTNSGKNNSHVLRFENGVLKEIAAWEPEYA